MMQLIGKIKAKGKKQAVYSKLISDKNIYAVDTKSLQLVPYAPDHNLDEDAWFKIDNFSQQPFCIELLKKAFVSSEYNDISSGDFAKIDYLCAVEGSYYYFQKITPSLYATRNSLSFGEKVQLEKNAKRLFIQTLPDAIYDKAKDMLVFKNLVAISSIFKGIDQLYKEATNEEVTLFLQQPFIELASDYVCSKVSKPNRKRVALAMNTLASMPSDTKVKMIAYISDYCTDKLTYDDESNKFNISTDEELKYLLYGIEQRFYTTVLDDEKRLANSIQILA